MTKQKKTTESEKNVNGIRAVERAVKVLKAFSRTKSQLNLSELAEIVDLNKSSLLRFLRTLEQDRFIFRDPVTSNYQLGVELIELGLIAQKSSDIQKVARPFLEDLNRQFDETIHLGVLEKGSVVFRDKINPVNKGYELASRVGHRIPVHCTAMGKILTSFMEDRALSEIIEKEGIKRYTPNTRTSIDDLREHLAHVRQNGFAIDQKEFNELVCCVAAPIFDHQGEPIAAVGLSSIGIDVNTKLFEEFTAGVQKTAGLISQSLGYVG